MAVARVAQLHKIPIGHFEARVAQFFRIFIYAKPTILIAQQEKTPRAHVAVVNTFPEAGRDLRRKHLYP